MDIERLKDFLITAKKSTYADEKNGKKVLSSRLNSKDYEFEDLEEGLLYHDTYVGGKSFAGQEIVYDAKLSYAPIWSMSYYGTAVDDDFNEEAIDKILRPALMKVGEDDLALPVRGPLEFVNGEYTYKFWAEGELNRFYGQEKIYKNGAVIYVLYCTGGFIV